MGVALSSGISMETAPTLFSELDPCDSNLIAPESLSCKDEFARSYKKFSRHTMNVTKPEPIVRKDVMSRASSARSAFFIPQRKTTEKIQATYDHVHQLLQVQ